MMQGKKFMVSPVTKKIKNYTQSIIGVISVISSGAIISACGGGDALEEIKKPPSLPPSEAPPSSPENRGTYNINRGKTEWTILRHVSPLNGESTVTLSASGDGISFNISCSGGERNYYLRTEFVLRSGGVVYRIGDNPVRREAWVEGDNFRTLYPRWIDKNSYSIYENLYRSRDVVFEVDRYNVGIKSSSLRAGGFPAAVDATRKDCGWPEEYLPPNNGWSHEIPDGAEAAATPNYFNSKNQFGFTAWRQYDASGKAFLMVRVGEDLSLCKGSFRISDKAFYVKQDGKEVDATPGFSFYSSCKETPFTLILQGNFDPARPLTIATYTILKEPMAELYLP